jgi:hypothetical protein
MTRIVQIFPIVVAVLLGVLGVFSILDHVSNRMRYDDLSGSGNYYWIRVSKPLGGDRSDLYFTSGDLGLFCRVTEEASYSFEAHVLLEGVTPHRAIRPFKDQAEKQCIAWAGERLKKP